MVFWGVLGATHKRTQFVPTCFRHFYLPNFSRPHQLIKRAATRGSAEMGCINTKPAYFDSADGDAAAYKERWEEGNVLGEGEFGKVISVTDKTGKIATPLAMKQLAKGFQWKDNTLYNPMSPEVLRTEVGCLRKLGGKRYNLKLEALYETPASLFIVTEMCSGGEMLDYLSEFPDGLRTEDISRISYQLLSAVDHCAKNGILHRDIKPENTMFKTKATGAELRLIDFGCAAMDGTSDMPYDSLVQHKTFAGTPFYIAPEVFHTSYSSRADVWSVGATLLVLVAGYPADELQKAFNMIQKRKKDLKKFPGMPEDMPETYFEMINGLLTYKPEKRMTCGEALKCEFVSFHKDLEGDQKAGKSKVRRTQSILFSQTGARHGAYMGYKKFERAMTTVLATVPSKEELETLLKKLDDKKQAEKAPEDDNDGVVASLMKKLAGDDKKQSEEAPEDDNDGIDSEKLNVIKVGDLKKKLLDLGLVDALATIEQLPNSSQYDSYSYSIELLREFSGKGGNAAASGAKSSSTDLGLDVAVSAATNAGPAGAAKGNNRRGQARFSMMAPPSQSAPPKRGLGTSGISTRF